MPDGMATVRKLAQAPAMGPGPGLDTDGRDPAHASAHFLDALLAGDGLAGALAGPGVSPRPLAVDRQPLAVAQPPVAADIAEPRDVLLDLAAQLAFHHVLVIEQAGELGEIVFAQVAGAFVGADSRP